jgi:hypothetical protein
MSKVHSNRPDSSNRGERPRRSAVGGAGSGGKLCVVGDLDPNYNYRFETDTGSNIEIFKSYGYEIVGDNDVKVSSTNPVQTGSSQTVVVDRATGAKGILMRQPKKYHEEDKKKRAEMIAKSEESMFRKLKTEDGRYGSVENTNSLAASTEDSN